MPLSTRREAEALRSAFTEGRILDAAEAAFARRGLEGTRIREIAEAAGLNGATLYNYFPGKEALYAAVLERGVRPLADLMDAFAAEPRGLDAGRALLDAVMAHLAEHPHVSRLIYLESIASGEHLHELARRWLGPLLASMTGVITRGPLPDGWDPDLAPLLAALFVHLSFGHFALAPLLREAMGTDPLSPENVARQTQLIATLVGRMFSQDPPAGMRREQEQA